MFRVARFIFLVIDQLVDQQKLKRVEEPDAVTSSASDIFDYDRVMESNLAVTYALGLEVISRARTEIQSDGLGQAIDLACGPGHFSLCLAKHLGYSTITGLDLSPGMIEVAQKNARLQMQDSKVDFQIADIINLDGISSQAYDLSTFTNAAHHMPNIQTVTKIFVEMERITKPGGIIVSIDLVRLRTKELTETYVNWLAHDYPERNLTNFLKDFKNSMLAAWTKEEMTSAIPKDSNRTWFHIVPRGLPTLQLIIGLPVGRKDLFVRKGFPWKKTENPVSKSLILLWKLARISLFIGSKKTIS